ncbi:autotransporter outer membrane beta-barrel domain-containing protein [Acetobacter ghanensis]|uniref:autotransporter outer membrane beta-barrel domain-containing protein n=1 Tax=Acetobacter ghanensis TaxID=431306 RepID=UPI003D348CC8
MAFDAADRFANKNRTKFVLFLFVKARLTAFLAYCCGVIFIANSVVAYGAYADGALYLAGSDATYSVSGSENFLGTSGGCTNGFIISPLCVDGGATLNVTGPDAALVSKNQIFIGYKLPGTSTLSIQDGGHMVANAAVLQAGWSGGNGVVNVSGAGSTLTALAGGLLVAGTGDNTNRTSPDYNTDQKTYGAINVTNGGTIIANLVGAGLYGTGVGTVTVDGANSLLRAEEQYYVNGGSGGAGGSGTTRISNGGQLVVNGQIFFGGDVTDGVGQLILQSGGTLELGDTVSNGQTVSALLDQEGAGGQSDFILSGGVIKLINSGLNTGMDMQLDGGVQSTFDTNGRTALLSGTLSGNGGLTKAGDGTLTLSGADTYTGNTDIQSGTLQLSGSGSISQTHGVHNNGQFDIADVTGGNAVSIRSMDGNGGVILGSNTLNITDGNSTFGNIYGGVISGSGSLILSGGATVLTGQSTYTGGTDVQAGMLQVDGGLVSPVTVESGATLAGHGSVGSTTVHSGANLLPGGNNASAPLTITGDLNMERGSTLLVNRLSTTQDQVEVTGAATLTGGNVRLLSAQGLQYGSQYTLVSAGGGVNGRYDAVSFAQTGVYPFLTPTLFYTPDTVDLQLVRNAVSFASVGQTRNQQAAGYGLQGVAASSAVSQAVVQLPDVRSVHTALDALSGEIHASARTVLLQDAFYVRQAVSDRLAAAFCDDWATDNGLHTAQVQHGHVVDGGGCGHNNVVLWGEAFGGLGHNTGDGNAASLHHSTAGFIMGADTPLGETGRWRAGGLVSYGRSMMTDGGRNSSGQSNNITVGGYVGAHWGGLSLNLGASYTWNMLALSRTVAFPGFRNTLSSHYNGGTAQGFGELGYRVHLRRAVFEPFGNVAYVNQQTDHFKEHGGAAALRGHAVDTGVTFATFGVRVSAPFHVYGVQVTPHGMLGYRHAFGLTTATAHEAFASTSGAYGMDVAGISLSRDAAVLEAGFSAKLTDRVDIGLSYLGQYGSASVSSGAHGRVTFRF